MMRNEEVDEGLEIEGFPDIDGLTLRRYRGKEDLPSMADLITRSREADGVDLVTTVPDLEAQYTDPVDFDPEADVVIVEVHGKTIGLARVWREELKGGKRVFDHSVELLGEWRGRGIREALFLHNERHIRRIATLGGNAGQPFYELWASDSSNEWRSIALNNGYEPVQHEIDMVRSLENIPVMPLPMGIEIRPVRPEHLASIWEAVGESNRDDWDYSENRWDDSHFEEFKNSRAFQPDLWQVAWKGDTLAGMVLNYIVDAENAQFKWKRGHTEYVFVREQFRGKGLARALLARSFRVLKEHGMDEATLGMEVENPHDPLRLYEGMGFRTVKHFTWYRKPIV
jgi:mycothiol synthase